MTSTTWITLLAYEARVRHAATCRREEGAAKRLASVRARVVADLRRAIALDIEGFLGEDGDRSGTVLICNGKSAQGFVVSRTDDRVGSWSLAVDLNAGTLRCRYDACGGSVDAAAAQRMLAIEIGRDGTTLSLWDGGLDRRFATIDALSAFLLAPLLGAA